MKSSVKRLYENFQPSHYSLSLEPNKKDKKFHGSVVVRGKKVGSPSQRIVLHQNSLEITYASITFHDKKEDREIKVSRINLHKKYDEVRLHVDEVLRNGEYTLELKFRGTITKSLSGIYPCLFEENGRKKELIATQFESHHAREAFPCIDEPVAKATFDLVLTVPKGETAISNTPLISRTDIDRKSVCVFETTPKMSTYLLAFVFGELKYLEKITKDGIHVRAYATPDKVAFTDFGLEVAVKCLEFYNEYFGIKYPLPKCDLVAVPDFAAGAMENWGCITFREQALLVDPENTSLSTKQYAALVVAHELAHQWFGNLVTMKWWTDLWLNEGFASWMEYFVIDSIYPEWELWVQFAVNERSQALMLDSLEHTHPVQVHVNHPDEIRTIFDAISYSKGASVLNMLFHYVGNNAFRDGLRYYLAKHSYSNTDTTDLWDALEQVSHKPVKSFMHDWTSRSGYPILLVNVGEKEVSLKQERFFINPKHHIKDNSVWPIALMSNNTDLPQIFNKSELNIKINNPQKLIINHKHPGLYRVAYNPTHLEYFGHLISRGHIEPLDRLGILSDVFESAKAGKSDTTEALHYISYYVNEDNYAVWDIITSAISSVRAVMNDESLREKMKPYVRDLVSIQLKRLGWSKIDGESHFDQLLRPIILSMASVADEPTVVKKCLDIFKEIEHVKGVRSDLRTTQRRKNVKRGIIDPDLRGTVFGTVARLGSEKEFEKLLELHNKAVMSEEKTTLVAALTGFKQPSIIKRSLSLINTDIVRLQDVTYWIAYSFLNRHAKRYAWEWLNEHWNWLEKNLGGDLSFYRMPIYVARAFCEEEFIKEYKEFFKPKMSPALLRSYQQGIEIIEYQSTWKKRDYKEVVAFFSK